MIGDVPCNHCVHCSRGFPFYLDSDLSLGAPHPSDLDSHTSEGVEATSVDAHFPQLAVAAAGDALDAAVLVWPPGFPSHFSSRSISEWCAWLAWPG